MPAVMKVQKLLDRAVKTLEASEAIDHWQKHRELYEATDLLMHAVGHDLDPDEAVSSNVRARFEAMIERRVVGEPVPYIKGFAEFRGLEVLAKPGVFVPRDSSEFLAEQAVRRLRKRKSPVHVDLACGGGPIALSVANEVPRADVYGADLSADRYGATTPLRFFSTEDGIDLVLDYSAYDNDFIKLIGQSPDVADTITTTLNAAPIFFTLFDSFFHFKNEIIKLLAAMVKNEFGKLVGIRTNAIKERFTFAFMKPCFSNFHTGIKQLAAFIAINRNEIRIIFFNPFKSFRFCAVGKIVFRNKEKRNARQICQN